MNVPKPLFWQTLTAALFIIATGCGRGGAAAIKTDLVEGVVTLDGQAVEGATVTFVPVQDGAGAAATGMTDAEGNYKLTAVGAGTGALPGAGTLPGEYYVGVLKNTFPGEPVTGDDPETLVKLSDKPGKRPDVPETPEVKHVVPQRFNDPRTSGIEVTVKEGANNIPIELKSN